MGFYFIIIPTIDEENGIVILLKEKNKDKKNPHSNKNINLTRKLSKLRKISCNKAHMCVWPIIPQDKNKSI